MVLARDLRRVLGDHLAQVLGIDELLQPRLVDRVEGDDLAPALHRVLQVVKEARAVGAGVLAEEEDRVASLEVVEHHGPDGRADQLLQGDRSGLVAHVGAVGQVVVPVEPGEQGVEVRGLQARAPRGVEDRGLRIERLQLPPDGREGLLPFAGRITVASAIVAHRVRQPAELLQIVVAPALQLGDRVLLEVLGRAAAMGQLP